jgi:quercetin dioxygenase-like cupin family protein
MRLLAWLFARHGKPFTIDVEYSSSQKENTMKEKEPMTMRPATGMAKRTSLTRCKIGLLGIFGICISLVALATPNAGVLSNVLSRATVGPFHVESESGRWELELQVSGISDIVTQTITLAPGGFSGWHTHPGPAIVSVKSGTLTLYQAGDPRCTPHVFPAGTGFVEHPGHVHIVRNEGTENLTVNATYIVPQGAPQRIDEPTPGNCPF